MRMHAVLCALAPDESEGPEDFVKIARGPPTGCTETPLVQPSFAVGHAEPGQIGQPMTIAPSGRINGLPARDFGIHV